MVVEKGCWAYNFFWPFTFFFLIFSLMLPVKPLIIQKWSVLRFLAALFCGEVVGVIPEFTVFISSRMILEALESNWRYLGCWGLSRSAKARHRHTSRGVHIFYFQQQEYYVMFTSESPYDLYIQYSCSLFFWNGLIADYLTWNRNLWRIWLDWAQRK